MKTDSKLELIVWSMPYLERLDGIQQRDGHSCDFTSVQDTVASRKTGHNHVGVADRLHLTSNQREFRRISGRTVKSDDAIDASDSVSLRCTEVASARAGDRRALGCVQATRGDEGLLDEFATCGIE